MSGLEPFVGALMGRTGTRQERVAFAERATGVLWSGLEEFVGSVAAVLGVPAPQAAEMVAAALLLSGNQYATMIREAVVRQDFDGRKFQAWLDAGCPAQQPAITICVCGAHSPGKPKSES